MVVVVVMFGDKVQVSFRNTQTMHTTLKLRPARVPASGVKISHARKERHVKARHT